MIHTGDCIPAMAEMEPESVDAIVTDPPYGLEFMGKEWDRFAPGKPQMTATGAADHMVDGSFGPWGRRKRPVTPNDNGRRNEKCRVCGKWRVSSNPCKCDKPEWVVRGREAAAPSMLALQAFSYEWARAAYRVAKPSAYLLAFGGTRTVHRLTCALEDAGWIIRDLLVWGYASGFPKSKASLKPAWEPIVMARKPGPLRDLAIDACRIPGGERPLIESKSEPSLNAYGDGLNGSRNAGTTVPARWPANIVLTDPTLGNDYSRFFQIEVDSCDWCGAPTVGRSSVRRNHPGAIAPSDAAILPAGMLDYTGLGSREPTTSGNGSTINGSEKTSWLDGDESTPSIPRSRQPETSPESTPPSSPAKSQAAASRGTVITTTMGDLWMCAICAAATTSATTSPSRNYPWALIIPKADRADREPVLGGLPERVVNITEGHGLGPVNTSKGGDGIRVNRPRANVHPTVKPTDLMRHLVRLVTPAGGVVLDCFAGSGSTLIAAEQEGFQWIGIERELEYVEIAEARLNGTQRGLAL